MLLPVHHLIAVLGTGIFLLCTIVLGALGAQARDKERFFEEDQSS